MDAEAPMGPAEQAGVRAWAAPGGWARGRGKGPRRTSLWTPGQPCLPGDAGEDIGARLDGHRPPRWRPLGMTLPLASRAGRGRGTGCAGHLSPLTRPPGGGHRGWEAEMRPVPTVGPQKQGSRWRASWAWAADPVCSPGSPSAVSLASVSVSVTWAPRSQAGTGDHYSASRMGLTGTQEGPPLLQGQCPSQGGLSQGTPPPSRGCVSSEQPHCWELG